jgi:hypothetical protein
MPRLPARRHATVGTIVSVIAAALVGSSSAGTTTKTFRQVTAKDFEEGEAVGTSVLPAGEVVPGLVTTRTSIDAAFVWCAVLGHDGETAYFGTGDEGRIFSVPLRGGPDVKAAARWLAKLDAAWVTALAVRKDGFLLAGTTPGGRVFTVNPKSGEARALGQVSAGHVWALVRDDQAALTYVGSGSPGKIFAIDDRGKVRQVWDSRDKHVVSLMKDTDGTLLAGTSENAILYRVHGDGRAAALQDFEAEEVRAVVRAPAGLFVAVNDFDKTSIAPAPPGPVAAKGTKIVLGTSGPPASAGSLPRPGARKAKAAVYRIEDDGRIEQVFALADGYLTALSVADDGSVFAAAGTQGHVFRVTPDGTASLVIDVPERQALTLVRSGATLVVGTGDVAGIYSARPPATPGGVYVSKVLDAEFPARWGTLRWLGNHVTFETRSGNTAKPDAGWAMWRSLDRNQIEPPGGAGHVASPGARYLQYRATLPAAASRLRGVTTNYLPQNQRARITEVTLADAAGATVAVAVAGATTTSARPAHSAVLKLRWKTENPDGDELVYRILFRQASESVWRPLTNAAADPLTKAEYDWNTEGIPDGLYIVRVTASDERAQPRDRALLSNLDSTPLLVDNRKPDVVDVTVHYPAVTGRARDDGSAIAQIEFSVDGGEFQLVSPVDGIADDPVESFSFKLPALARGPHALAIRATDSAENIGAAQTMVTVP